MTDNSTPTVHVVNQLGVDVEVNDLFETTSTLLGRVSANDAASLPAHHSISHLLVTAPEVVQGMTYRAFPTAVLVADEEDTEFAVTEDDLSAMKQAFAFIQYISAFPASDLAKHFLDLINPQQSLSQQKDAINEFFQHTPGFQKATWVAWHAIINWQTSTLAPWQGPYYLYTLNSAQGSDAATGVRLVAIVNIQEGAQDEQATIQLAGADGTVATGTPSYELVMDPTSGALVLKEQGTVPLSVSLQPAWLSLPQSSDTQSLAPAIGVALSGTVNNQQVTGTQQSRELPQAEAAKLLPSQVQGAASQRAAEFDKWFSKLSELVGMLVGIGMLYIMYKQWKEGHERPARGGEPEGGARERVDELSERITRSQQEVRAQIDQVPQLNREIAEARAEPIASRASQRALTEQTEAIHQQLRDAVELGAPDPSLEKMYETLKRIEGGQTEGFESLQAELSDLRAQVDQMLQERGDQVDAEMRQSLEDTRAATEQLAEQQQALQEDVERSLEPSPEAPEGEDTAIERMEPDPIEDFPFVE